MIKKFGAAAATFLLVLAGALTVASPAQADEEDCPESNIYGYICLWKWIEYGGGRYQGSLATIKALEANGDRPASCWNLTGSTFGSPHSGQPVNNESASMVIEPSVYNWKVRLYDWINCNESSAMYTRTAYNTYTSNRHLGGEFSPTNMYHRITSIRVYE